jgi:hypothetical protein
MADYTRTPGFDFSLGAMTPEGLKPWLEHVEDVAVEKQRIRGPEAVTTGEKLMLFGTESANAFSEGVARAIRGAASLAGDEEDMETLDNHIARARDFLRGPSPYYAGQERFTVTGPGSAVGEGLGLLIPYALLRGRGVPKLTGAFPHLSKIWKGLTPKQKIATDAVGFGVSDFMFADPKDLHTFGDYLGGPTAIKPDDSILDKKAKMFAEGIVLGGTISAAGHKLFQAFQGKKPPIYNTDPKSLRKGQKAVDPDDSAEYTWVGAQWVNDSTGRVAAKKVGEKLTFFALNSEADYLHAAARADAASPLLGKKIPVTFPRLQEGTVRTVGNTTYEWKGAQAFEDMSSQDLVDFGWEYFVRTGKTPSKAALAKEGTRPRWIDQKTGKPAGDDIQLSLNREYGPGKREVEWTTTGWRNAETGTPLYRDSFVDELNATYRPEVTGSRAVPQGDMASSAGKAFDQSIPSSGLRGVQPPPTGPLSRFRAAAQRAGDKLALELEVLGFKSISSLDGLARVSPSFRQLRHMLHAFEESDNLKGIRWGDKGDFFEEMSKRIGKYTTLRDNALKELTAAFPQSTITGIGRAIPGVRMMFESTRELLPQQVQLQILRALRGGRTPQELNEAVTGIRTLLNEVAKDAKLAKLPMNIRKNYFPRVWEVGKLNTETGRNFLRSKGMKEDQIEGFIKELSENSGVEDASIVKDLFERPRKGGPAPRSTKKMSNIEKSRTFLKDVPDNELEPFLNNNLFDILTTYTSNAARRISYADLFGAKEGTLSNLVRAGIDEAAAVGRPATQKELSRIYDIADALQQRVDPVKHAPSWGRKMNILASTYQNTRLLSLATLASLAEPLVALERGGPAAFARAVPSLISTASRSMVRTAFRGVSRSEADIMARDIGMALDTGENSMLQRLVQGFGGEVNKWNIIFFDATLLSQWTKLTRIFSDQVGQNLIESNIKALATNPNLSRNAQERFARQLADLGMDADEAVKWYKQGRPQQGAFFEKMKTGRIRFINDVIVNPRVTNRPYWHSDARFGMISNLKGFQTVFGNTIMKRWYRKFAPEAMGGRGVPATEKNLDRLNILATGVGMMAVINVASDLRDVAKYGGYGKSPRKKKWTPWDRFWDNIYRSGFLGSFQFAVDAKRSVEFGSSPLGAILGPTVAQAERAIERPNLTTLKQAVPVMGQSQFFSNRLEEIIAGRKPLVVSSTQTPSGGGTPSGAGAPSGSRVENKEGGLISKEFGGPITSGEVVDETEWLTSPYEPMLNKYGIKARRAERPEGKGGYAEYYPAEERDNPMAGTPLIEIYNKEISGPNLENLVIGEAIHGLKTMDPVVKKMTDEFKYIMKSNPVQKKITQNHYRNAQNRETPEQRTQDKWFETSYADQVMGNMLFGPIVEGQEFMEGPYPYTDRQVEIGQQLMAYLQQSPNPRLQEGGIVGAGMAFPSQKSSPTIKDILEKIASHETKGYKNPWVRTSYAPLEGSSAFGPLQMTKKSLLDISDENLTPELRQFKYELIEEQTKGLEFGREPEKEGYEEIYEYSDTPGKEDYNPEKGTYKWGSEGLSEEEQALYWQLGNQLFRRKAEILRTENKNEGYDLDNLSEEEIKEIIGAWHGGGEDITVEEYVKKVLG